MKKLIGAATLLSFSGATLASVGEVMTDWSLCVNIFGGWISLCISF